MEGCAYTLISASHTFAKGIIPGNTPWLVGQMECTHSIRIKFGLNGQS